MKKNNTAKSAALLALMGLIQVSTAQADGHSFIPLENLPPEQRQVLSEQLNALTKDINVNWDEIAVGVDENGKLTFMSKSECGMRQLASSSSFSSTAFPKEEEK